MGQAAKMGPRPTPRVKLEAPESTPVTQPVIWLGSSSTVEAVKETECGGPQPLLPGPPPLLVSEPGVTVT